MHSPLILAALAASFLMAAPASAHHLPGGAGHDHEAATQDHAHAAAAAEAPADDSVTWQVGALTIVAPYSRATLPNAPVAGGFLTITNEGQADDRLIAAVSEVADHVEIHEMAMDGDVMTMRELSDGLTIPAGETVALQPGGYHLMFIQLNEPLIEGESVEVTLTFEDAGEITVPLSIQAFNARAADDRQHDVNPHAGH